MDSSFTQLTSCSVPACPKQSCEVTIDSQENLRMWCEEHTPRTGAALASSLPWAPRTYRPIRTAQQDAKSDRVEPAVVEAPHASIIGTLAFFVPAVVIGYGTVRLLWELVCTLW